MLSSVTQHTGDKNKVIHQIYRITICLGHFSVIEKPAGLFTSISFAYTHLVMQSKRVYLLTAAVSWKAGLEKVQEENTKSNNNPKKRSRVSFPYLN